MVGQSRKRPSSGRDRHVPEPPAQFSKPVPICEGRKVSKMALHFR